MIKCENDGSSYGIQGALRVRSEFFSKHLIIGHPALMELHGELGRVLFVDYACKEFCLLQ